ncbi:hypothetical protein ACLE20_09460 [Rhizobium sp. YIM 134829]|uniref:hypothetical protein n=1 Tax=Rhizobium sp. YIM 134829 TaxID=3390453 RepID=UPI003978E25D
MPAAKAPEREAGLAGAAAAVDGLAGDALAADAPLLPSPLVPVLLAVLPALPDVLLEAAPIGRPVGGTVLLPGGREAASLSDPAAAARALSPALASEAGDSGSLAFGVESVLTAAVPVDDAKPEVEPAAALSEEVRSGLADDADARSAEEVLPPAAVKGSVAGASLAAPETGSAVAFGTTGATGSPSGLLAVRSIVFGSVSGLLRRGGFSGSMQFSCL